MKKMRTICTVLSLVLTMTAASGCFIVDGQKMKKVKGTYQLTRYSDTPSYERKEGYTPKTFDYIADYGYEVYLVVTGESRGYYVHKDNNTPAYSKEVSLSYTYSQENSAEVEYVAYSDLVTTNAEENRFGVTKDALNYSLPAFDYTQLFTKKPMRSDEKSISWKKVDNATDLSYAKEKLGEIKEYGYEEFALKGVYELSNYTSVNEQTETLENPYQYFFVAVETATGKTSAKVYYALKSDGIDRSENYAITKIEGWQKVKIGDMEWTKEAMSDNTYSYITSEIKQTIVLRDRDNSEKRINELIAEKKPTE